MNTISKRKETETLNLVGCGMIYSQFGATHLIGYLSFHVSCLVDLFLDIVPVAEIVALSKRRQLCREIYFLVKTEGKFR